MNSSQAISLYEFDNPYGSALARANSGYTACVDGELVRLLDWKEPPARARLVHETLVRFIGAAEYPCVGAKAAMNQGHYRFASYHSIGSPVVTAGLARDLSAFTAERPLMRTDYASFIAVFDDVGMRDPLRFEAALWTQLSQLHALDREHTAWDPSVNPDADAADFAFSFGGCAYFVVGLHPGSSRLARRFPWPVLVFNPHRQFDALRAQGIYDRFKDIVRSRELALQGSLNPNLADFGAASEARQYSGRAVDAGWKCPFRP
ncbi:MAG: hypothetical protein DLM53_00630 [Candidatus Eremiobacter antarcticus]|nr:YqcI/YcgG family protein [Candidatus Eremiobacteraeota bacterium]MBC5809037.1 YqcI/YcgG family protein [Candidatus Eremiobacteraeota bacterium]PZR64272.1 MAG: hypothetical protein DLM53_00630 [Candidatus Eremiobacter sp. RRmetagenome_bin22]